MQGAATTGERTPSPPHRETPAVLSSLCVSAAHGVLKTPVHGCSPHTQRIPAALSIRRVEVEEPGCTGEHLSTPMALPLYIQRAW